MPRKKTEKRGRKHLSSRKAQRFTDHLNAALAKRWDSSGIAGWRVTPIDTGVSVFLMLREHGDRIEQVFHLSAEVMARTAMEPDAFIDEWVMEMRTAAYPGREA